MAASRSMGAFAGGANGAQMPVLGTSNPAAPAPGAGPSFAQVLQSMTPAMMPEAAPMTGRTPPMTPVLPHSMPQDAGSRLPRLPDMPRERPGLAALATHMARKPMLPAAPPKAEFVAGTRPEPTGPTGHEIATAHADKLEAVIGDLKAKGMRPTAANLAETWNARHPDMPANSRRIRTAYAKHSRAQATQMTAQMERYLLSGAKRALKEKP